MSVTVHIRSLIFRVKCRSHIRCALLACVVPARMYVNIHLLAKGKTADDDDDNSLMLTRSDVGTNSPKSIIFRNCMLAKCYFIDTTACLFLSATKSCALFDPTPD